jgi:hydroxymethylbilane synthase
VICGAPSLAALHPGAHLGTSSLRRSAQVRAARDDVDVVPLRGNVDTRLRKLADGEVDALVLAAAGLERLGRSAEAGGVLAELVPAAGQGALLIEGRAGGVGPDRIAMISDPETTACVTSERELVHALGASCNTPVGAHARRISDTELELRAWVGLPDGSVWISDRLQGPATGLGAAMAERLRSVGADELLAKAEREVHA